MANSLGERVWIEDATDGGHWEYRTSKDRLRLDEQAKVRNQKINQSIKTYKQKAKIKKANTIAFIKQSYKNGTMTSEQARNAMEMVKKKYG